MAGRGRLEGKETKGGGKGGCHALGRRRRDVADVVDIVDIDDVVDIVDIPRGSRARPFRYRRLNKGGGASRQHTSAYVSIRQHA